MRLSVLYPVDAFGTRYTHGDRQTMVTYRRDGVLQHLLYATPKHARPSYQVRPPVHVLSSHIQHGCRRLRVPCSALVL
ncbi:hypothetical protein ARTHRO8AJ_10051 [Arthrobacter sp. 8AJ]|nr:hypothetical protein ARTHRO8AJ_10051 [Arthrobacter sp. 8AJ]